MALEQARRFDEYQEFGLDQVDQKLQNMAQKLGGVDTKESDKDLFQFTKDITCSFEPNFSDDEKQGKTTLELLNSMSDEEIINLGSMNQNKENIDDVLNKLIPKIEEKGGGIVELNSFAILDINNLDDPKVNEQREIKEKLIGIREDYIEDGLKGIPNTSIVGINDPSPTFSPKLQSGESIKIGYTLLSENTTVETVKQ